MEIEQLKQISIPDLLSSLGHEPASRMRGGRQLMYYSPLRGDSNPSFSVSVDRNLWFDDSAVPLLLYVTVLFTQKANQKYMPSKSFL